MGACNGKSDSPATIEPLAPQNPVVGDLGKEDGEERVSNIEDAQEAVCNLGIIVSVIVVPIGWCASTCF